MVEAPDCVDYYPGWVEHADQLFELLRSGIAWEQHTIFGDRRHFVLRHRVSGERWSWDLGHGDLLVMRGKSQSEFAHAVPKTSRPVGPRMNLTFRCFQLLDREP
jgi:hypothetical protein